VAHDASNFVAKAMVKGFEPLVKPCDFPIASFLVAHYASNFAFKADELGLELELHLGLVVEFMVGEPHFII